MMEKIKNDYRRAEADTDKFTRSTVIGLRAIMAIEGIGCDVEDYAGARIIKPFLTTKDNIRSMCYFYPNIMTNLR